MGDRAGVGRHGVGTCDVTTARDRERATPSMTPRRRVLVMQDEHERARLIELAGRDVAAPTVAIAAATVVLLRDRDDAGTPEILMLRRDAKLSFAADRWVFPGGKLDEEDFPRGVRSEDPTELAEAEARAAVREAAEESGLVIDGSSMIRWSHWTPPPQETRRFSTAFFVAAAPDGDVVIDDGEIRDHQWVTATGALALRDRGEIELLPRPSSRCCSCRSSPPCTNCSRPRRTIPSSTT